MRSETYRRLRRHWQFVNELSLFEIDHHVSYGVHVYGHRNEDPKFQMAASLYHPDTVERSLLHDGFGDVPGLKDPDGNWDLRPHKERIIDVDVEVLKVWSTILDEPGTPALHARMVYPVNLDSSRVLEKLSHAPRVRELNLDYSSGWHETADRRKGFFEVGSSVPLTWDDVILQGPHITVATPLVKQPNATMKNNLDWSELDLEDLDPDFIPRTSYRATSDEKYFRSGLRSWGNQKLLRLTFIELLGEKWPPPQACEPFMLPSCLRALHIFTPSTLMVLRHPASVTSTTWFS
ncbi:hypothetical protein PJ267_09115 [Arthrobacter sp. OVS8]|nr:hypothetical protein PJ267_09115 [Arthrobacter sp. OVS8]